MVVAVQFVANVGIKSLRNETGAESQLAAAAGALAEEEEHAIAMQADAKAATVGGTVFEEARIPVPIASGGRPRLRIARRGFEPRRVTSQPPSP
jgi:hypothetical protein